MKKSNLGYVLVLIAALMWGSIGIFVNGISAMGVTSQSMAAFRLLSGAVLMAPVLAFMGCQEVLVRERHRVPGTVQGKP